MLSNGLPDELLAAIHEHYEPAGLSPDLPDSNAELRRLLAVTN